MTLGLFLVAGQFPGTTHTDTLASAVRYAAEAERVGLHGVWLAEHHFIRYGVCPSAVAFAGFLLGHTSRIEVGTAACVLSARHPVALAEETALLDQLSGGRFRLGVARGGPWLELEVLGTGLARYTRGFAESLDLTLRWLESDRVGATGEFFTFRAATVVPRPLTRPRPPVWVAATGVATVDLAASRGVPLLLGVHQDDAGKAALLDRYARVAAAHGHDPALVPHAGVVLVQVTDDPAETVALLRGSMSAWTGLGLRDYLRVDGSVSPSRAPLEYVDHLLRIHPVGPADHCAEQLARTIRRTGIRRLLLMVEGTGDIRKTMRNINRIGTQVLPLLDRCRIPSDGGRLRVGGRGGTGRR